jgi:hypothetical protein
LFARSPSAACIRMRWIVSSDAVRMSVSFLILKVFVIVTISNCLIVLSGMLLRRLPSVDGNTSRNAVVAASILKPEFIVCRYDMIDLSHQFGPYIHEPQLLKY